MSPEFNPGGTVILGTSNRIYWGELPLKSRFRMSVFVAVMLPMLGILSACANTGSSNGNPNANPPSAPTITTQPTNQTVSTGQTATFTVVAAGTSPLSYQWYENGTPIGTNSSTYTTSPTTAADNQAQMEVKVSNSAGSVTSNAATLTVTVTDSEPIPSSLFGMHVIDYRDWPTVTFAALGKGTGVGWSAIEPTKGQFNWARLDEFVNEASSHGVSSFYAAGGVPSWAAADQSTCHSNVWGTSCTGTVANMQDWDDFVTELASRYGGRIQVYELWNEPQNFFTGTYAQLAALTQQECNIIRSIDPSATILSPSMVSYGYAYLDNYFAAGGTTDIDGVAMHSYPNTNNDIAETVTGSMTTTIRGVMSKYGLSGKPIWDTEGSWGNTSSGAITDPDLRAAFVARSYLLHWSIGISRFYWYAWDSPNWGALWSSTSGPSEAAIAYEQVYNWMVGATMAQPCSLNGATSSYHAIITCDLTRSSGYEARAVWNTDGSSTYTAPSQFTQYRDLTGNKYSVPSSHEVPIGLKPILLENF